jgi:tetratricopeptide (TPR) repeat protein
MTILTRRIPTARTRPLAFVGACVVVVAATYVAALIQPMPRPTDARPPAPAHQPSVSLARPAAGSGSDALIAALDDEIGLWRASVAANEADFIAAGRLGQLTLQRARISGDLADYERALAAAEQAVAADPIYWPGHSLRASALFALHDFAGALKEATATFEADPEQLDALAVIGDASLELGDVAVAGSAYAELAERAPSAPVWSRMAHLAFVRGEVEEALALIERCLAATPAEEDPAGAAFYAFQLAELHRSTGSGEAAAAAYERSLDVLEGYVPSLAGLAHVREAQGDRAAAIGLLERATAGMPQPDLVAALGDLYALSGDAQRAEEQYALVERIGAVAAATGGVYDRQLIVFAADHGRNVDQALTESESALALRRDVYGLDAHAWMLFAAGRVDEAAEDAREALAVGTPDPRIAYHAGMIAAAQGRADEARHLLGTAVAGRAALPPLQAERAAEALAALGQTVER